MVRNPTLGRDIFELRCLDFSLWALQRLRSSLVQAAIRRRPNQRRDITPAWLTSGAVQQRQLVSQVVQPAAPSGGGGGGGGDSGDEFDFGGGGGAPAPSHSSKPARAPAAVPSVGGRGYGGGGSVGAPSGGGGRGGGGGDSGDEFDFGGGGGARATNQAPPKADPRLASSGRQAWNDLQVPSRQSVSRQGGSRVGGYGASQQRGTGQCKHATPVLAEADAGEFDFGGGTSLAGESPARPSSNYVPVLGGPTASSVGLPTQGARQHAWGDGGGSLAGPVLDSGGADVDVHGVFGSPSHRFQYRSPRMPKQRERTPYKPSVEPPPPPRPRQMTLPPGVPMPELPSQPGMIAYRLMEGFDIHVPLEAVRHQLPQFLGKASAGGAEAASAITSPPLKQYDPFMAGSSSLLSPGGGGHASNVACLTSQPRSQVAAETLGFSGSHHQTATFSCLWKPVSGVPEHSKLVIPSRVRFPVGSRVDAQAVKRWWPRPRKGHKLLKQHWRLRPEEGPHQEAGFRLLYKDLEERNEVLRLELPLQGCVLLVLNTEAASVKASMKGLPSQALVAVLVDMENQVKDEGGRQRRRAAKRVRTGPPPPDAVARKVMAQLYDMDSAGEE